MPALRRDDSTWISGPAYCFPALPVLVFLASDAAAYFTGQVIGVNGGMYV